MTTEPTFVAPAGTHRGVLVWRWPELRNSLASAPVGGGLERPDWALNIGVPANYSRTDLNAHASEIAGELDLMGTGLAFFTAADVALATRGVSDGVTVDATVGISQPTWAADKVACAKPWSPGTINLVVQLPTGLDPAAAVNAVITATEAKTQALLEQGIAGTGTASDAIAVVWPADGEAASFGGPRSHWGSRIANATFDAVTSGIAGHTTAR